jgi:hypothetical protein
VYSPISGEVVEINQALVDEPAKVMHTPSLFVCYSYGHAADADVDDLL